MKAVAKTESGPGLELIDVPKPQLKPNEILVRVTHAAICGTDLHIYEWDGWAQTNIDPPRIVGHEFVGLVEAEGQQVSGFELGDRVVIEGHIICSQCRNCKSGDGHFCRNTQGVGVHRDGGFAQYVAVPAVNAYAVPDFLTDEMAAILDPLGNAVHTALSFDLVGEDVLITGAGPIGQMAAAVCRHAGARHIVVTDPQPARLATAAQMGASKAIAPGVESIQAAMEELDMKEGFDVALEMSGNSRAVHDIINNITHGGEVALLGLFSSMSEVDLNQIILKGVTIKGIYGREIFDTWYKAVAMLKSGLNIEPLITHRFPLDDFKAGFEVLQSGDAQKIILEIK